MCNQLKAVPSWSPNSTDLHFWYLCQQTNRKDIAGQSATSSLSCLQRGHSVSVRMWDRFWGCCKKRAEKQETGATTNTGDRGAWTHYLWSRRFTTVNQCWVRWGVSKKTPKAKVLVKTQQRYLVCCQPVSTFAKRSKLGGFHTLFSWRTQPHDWPCYLGPSDPACWLLGSECPFREKNHANGEQAGIMQLGLVHNCMAQL